LSRVVALVRLSQHTCHLLQAGIVRTQQSLEPKVLVNDAVGLAETTAQVIDLYRG
jgi:hypothetical protein